jgi:hypothetical protein
VRTAARPASGHKTPPKRSRQSVNLFIGGKLVATRWTERDRPHPFYVIDHVTYEVIKVVRTVDTSGHPAFDVDVAARPHPNS